MTNIYLTKWVSFWVFIFSIGVLTYSAHPAIVLLFTMFYVVLFERDCHFNFALDKEGKLFVYLILFWFFLQLFDVVYQPEGYEYESIKEKFNAFDNASRWLLMLPVFFLLRRYIVDWRLVAVGMSIGVFITVSVAHYEVYFLGLNRAEGLSNHTIPFSELMVAADLLLWMLMIHAWNKGEKILSYFLLLSSIVAFYGSLLSATRGAWLAYVFMILIWLIHTIKNSLYNKKYLLSKPILLRLLFAVIVFFAVSQTHQYETLKSRTSNTINDINNGNYQGASSSRLSIFKDAASHIEKYPFGIGTRNFEKIDPNGYPYNAHNQLLNIWVENGIQGVISFLLLIGFSFRFFWKNLNHSNSTISVYASCGLMLIVSYIIFSQSQTIFDHHQTLIFFIFYLYFFFAQIQALNKPNQIV
jgi:O-antigen ligase